MAICVSVLQIMIFRVRVIFQLNTSYIDLILIEQLQLRHINLNLSVNFDFITIK
jgi:hypothetical protein